jgi:putative cell wall-binding protein
MLKHSWKHYFSFLILTGLIVSLPRSVFASGDLARLSGTNRIETALTISQRLFPIADSAGAVVLARSDAFPDALTAASLGGLLMAPILLTPSGQPLSKGVQAEIDRVLLPGKPVIIVGGTSALQASIDSLLAGTYSVERLAGGNRYDTAKLIKERGDTTRGSAATSVIVASGDTFPDALSGSSYAAFSGTPIVLVKKEKIPVESAALLTTVVDAAFVIGGTAVISDAVVTSIEAGIGNVSQRLSGADRYATSVAVANFFFTTPLAVAIATGLSFPDALSGSVLAGKTALSTSGIPLLLAKPTSVPPSILDYLSSHAATIDDTTSGYVFGGTSAISGSTEIVLEQAL